MGAAVSNEFAANADLLPVADVVDPTLVNGENCRVDFVFARNSAHNVGFSSQRAVIDIIHQICMILPLSSIFETYLPNALYISGSRRWTIKYNVVGVVDVQSLRLYDTHARAAINVFYILTAFTAVQETTSWAVATNQCSELLRHVFVVFQLKIYVQNNLETIMCLTISVRLTFTSSSNLVSLQSRNSNAISV
ncbi:hypothetical protein CHS0354_042428 [Potamilus streckersoni]|uniref:Uncharacterized protein n=1 Tax=Potamilus streckersoni TaxID=2493646 RepID=A0AAE0STX2_9BIVA|nr:hypothetical protein CHS0354_042428 [Potamilus streckersoni]